MSVTYDCPWNPCQRPKINVVTGTEPTTGCLCSQPPLERVGSEARASNRLLLLPQLPKKKTKHASSPPEPASGPYHQTHIQDPFSNATPGRGLRVTSTSACWVYGIRAESHPRTLLAGIRSS